MSRERPQTFMEIGGYPHYENVSNFLRFFFDPEGPHGLGSLFLDALLASVGAGGEEGLGGNVSVEREVGTAAGNRIDILIQSDSHAVLIENKIFAAAANPFDLRAYLDSLKNENGDAYEDEIKTKILLTLLPVQRRYRLGFPQPHPRRLRKRSTFQARIPRIQSGYSLSDADAGLSEHARKLGGRDSNEPGIRQVACTAERRSEKFLTQVRGEARGRRETGELIDLKEHQNVTQLPWRPNQITIRRTYCNTCFTSIKNLTLSSIRQSRRADGKSNSFIVPGAQNRLELEDLAKQRMRYRLKMIPLFSLNVLRMMTRKASLLSFRRIEHHRCRRSRNSGQALYCRLTGSGDVCYYLARLQ